MVCLPNTIWKFNKIYKVWKSFTILVLYQDENFGMQTISVTNLLSSLATDCLSDHSKRKHVPLRYLGKYWQPRSFSAKACSRALRKPLLQSSTPIVKIRRNRNVSWIERTCDTCKKDIPMKYNESGTNQIKCWSNVCNVRFPLQIHFHYSSYKLYLTFKFVVGSVNISEIKWPKCYERTRANL